MGEGGEGFFGEEASGAGMGGVAFGDDGISGGDGGGEITTADGVVGKREIVGAEDGDGADGGVNGADVEFGIDGGEGPGAFEGSGGGFTELAGGAGQFDFGEAGGGWEGGFLMGDVDDFGGAGLDAFGEASEELGKICGKGFAQSRGGFSGGGKDGIEIGPGTDGILSGERFAGGRIGGLERFGRGGGSPLAIDEDWMDGHEELLGLKRDEIIAAARFREIVGWRPCLVHREFGRCRH